jgi:hypothetical protein
MIDMTFVGLCISIIQPFGSIAKVKGLYSISTWLLGI